MLGWSLLWLEKYILLKGNQKVSSSKEITVLEGSGTTETGSETIEGLTSQQVQRYQNPLQEDSQVSDWIYDEFCRFFGNEEKTSRDSVSAKRSRVSLGWHKIILEDAPLAIRQVFLKRLGLEDWI